MSEQKYSDGMVEWKMIWDFKAGHFSDLIANYFLDLIAEYSLRFNSGPLLFWDLVAHYTEIFSWEGWVKNDLRLKTGHFSDLIANYSFRFNSGVLFEV